jgi:glycine reductase complex component B subunit alpha and beta
VVITAEPKPGVKAHEHEAALRTLGLKAAAFLGQAIKDIEPDEIKTYETLAPREAALLYPDLPRVGYVYMLQTQGLLHDTYVYGVDAKKLVPLSCIPLKSWTVPLSAATVFPPATRIRPISI